MAYSTVAKPSDHFTVHRYTGNGQSGRSVTTGTFQPDCCWIRKIESGSTGENNIFDAVRGATKRLLTNGNDAESTQAAELTAFDSTGFTTGNAGGTNGTGDAMISYNWKANGAGSANTDGTINSTVSVNSTAGFSIVKYAGIGGSTATVGHGLGTIPDLVMIKSIDGTENWCVSQRNMGSDTTVAQLNLNNSPAVPTYIQTDRANNTSSVFYIGIGGPVTGAGNNFIAYCYKNTPGFSKFNRYVGNGSATNGTFVYTGFAPAFVICKLIGSDNWMLYNNQIGTTNPTGSQTVYEDFNRHGLFTEANDSGAVQSAGSDQGMDMYSNGFKVYEDASNLNGNGSNYIYMAFAAQPLVSTNNNAGTAR